MLKINWKVRFNKDNLNFVTRFAAALLVPVLSYLGINWEDLNTWGALGEALLAVVSNPFLLGLIFVNGLILLPDPTTSGWGDSKRALTYDKPRKDGE